MNCSENIGLENLYASSVLGKVLFPNSVIRQRVCQIGKAITDDYCGKEPILVSVLRGGIIFVTDLSRKIDLELSIDFIGISTYQGNAKASTGVVKITKDLEETIEGKDIIIVEDIIDTGLTVNYLLRNLKSRNPASVEICTLLDRNIRRIVETKIKYTGFTIGEEFVVGYGLDYKQKYRNLDAIYELNRDMVKRDIEINEGSRNENG